MSLLSLEVRIFDQRKSNMETLEKFFSGIDPVVAALIATTFTWLVTAAGAALVFFLKPCIVLGWMPCLVLQVV